MLFPPTIAIGCAAVSLATCAFGSEIFVSPSGSGSGTSRRDPMASIAGALARARPGDTITLLPGRFRQPFNVSVQGREGQPIILRSVPRHQAVIDLSGGTKIKVHGAAHFVMDGLDIGRSPTKGLRIAGSKFVRILHCKIHDNQYEGVFISRCEDVEVAHCEIYRNGDLAGKPNNIDGLMSRFVKRGRYHHNNVHHNASSGLDVGATTDSVIEQNFIHHNGVNFNGPGIKLLHEGPKSEDGYCHGTVVRNNIFLDNESCGVFLSAGSGETGKLYVVNNTIIVRRVAQHGGLRWDSGSGGHGGINMPNVNNVFKNNIVYVVQPSGAAQKSWQYNNCIHWKRGMKALFGRQFVDHNLFYHNRQRRFACEAGGAPTDFSRWQRLSGLDGNSRFRADVFVGLVGDTAAVARLQEQSAAIDAGVDLGKLVTDDFYGRPRSDGRPDIGAIEFAKH